MWEKFQVVGLFPFFICMYHLFLLPLQLQTNL